MAINQAQETRVTTDTTVSFSGSPFVIGVAGGSGAGKTTIVERLHTQYSEEGVSVVDLDSYYKDHSDLCATERAALNFDDPASVDFDLLWLHIEQLRLGRRIAKPVYSFATHTRTSQVSIVDPAPFVIVEGILALHDPRLRSLMDVKLYIEADADIRFIRRLRRDILERGRTTECVIKQYLATVRPMHLQYIAPSRAFADLVVDGTGSLDQEMREINNAIRAVGRKRLPMSARAQYELAEVR
jgi:uridine kinase